MPRTNTAATPERTPRSFWFDPRFAVGVCLILASVLGVLWIVSTADRTVEVLSAAGPLSPGDRVAAVDFGVQSVRLGVGRRQVPHPRRRAEGGWSWSPAPSPPES